MNIQFCIFKLSKKFFLQYVKKITRELTDLNVPFNNLKEKFIAKINIYHCDLNFAKKKKIKQRAINDTKAQDKVLENFNIFQLVAISP